MTDSPQVDFERIKSEIFRLAEMKYDCCTYDENPQKTAQLRGLLENHEQLNTLDIGLFQYKYLLGYKKGSDDKPEIVPEEAEIVRMIYNLFLDGYSMRNIKTVLESNGFLTATGKKIWNESLISSILKNEKYVGDVLMQKTYTLDCITHKVVKNHGERPMYLVTDHHDPIVDRLFLVRG